MSLTEKHLGRILNQLTIHFKKQIKCDKLNKKDGNATNISVFMVVFLWFKDLGSNYFVHYLRIPNRDGTNPFVDRVRLMYLVWCGVIPSQPRFGLKPPKCLKPYNFLISLFPCFFFFFFFFVFCFLAKCSDTFRFSYTWCICKFVIQFLSVRFMSQGSKNKMTVKPLVSTSDLNFKRTVQILVIESQ